MIIQFCLELDKFCYVGIRNCIGIKNESLEILQKAAEYYLKNTEATKQGQGIDTKTCQKNLKARLRSFKEKDISN